MGPIKLNGLIDGSEALASAEELRLASVRRFKQPALKSKHARDFNYLSYIQNRHNKFFHVAF